MSMLKRVMAAKQRAEAAAVPEPQRFEPVRIARLASERIEAVGRFEKEHGANAVPNSPDLERILALPRRPPPEEESPEGRALIERMTARLANGRAAGDGCACALLNPSRFDGTPGSACITALRFIQAWYLAEAEEVQGCLGPIAVGAGKTGIDVLTAMVVPGCKQAVLLLPPGLKPQFLADFALWAQHFKVPNISGGPGAALDGRFVPGRPVLHVLKYSELSSPKVGVRWFADRPEISVVIADEAQALKARNAVRVGRFIDHFIANPETRFFCHTGSLTSRGIEDYSHLSALALRQGSPVPIEPHTVTSWGSCLNPQKGPAAPPGALMTLCQPGEAVEHGFARRFIETKGVVATFEGSLAGVELRVSERKPPPMPEAVRKALADVRQRMVRPDGEELQEALEVARVAREVACGFHLYWHYPHAVPADFEKGGKIDQWFAKRQAWNREVRRKLEQRAPELDSEGLLKAAARRAAEGYKGKLPVWHSDTWEAWAAVEKTVPHETRVKWLDDWLARDAAAWMAEMEAKGTPGIVWVGNPAFGQMISRVADRPYFGAGDDAAVGIKAENDQGAKRSIVASIAAHHRGRNLQNFSANLVTQPPGSSEIWEQLLGRTHRSLQRATVVTVEIYQHVAELKESFDTAMGRALYAKSTTRADQKLLGAADSRGNRVLDIG